MKCSRIRCIVVILTLLAYLLTPAGAAWHCEGRQCGTTPWVCCCHGEDCDRECQQAAVKQDGDALTLVNCNCMMVMNPTPSSVVTASAPSVFPPLALLPLSLPTLVIPVVDTPSLYAAAPRGPPRAPLALTLPSPRAPPIACVPAAIV